jgi:ABC-2 type transport system ATP-binding protein
MSQWAIRVAHCRRTYGSGRQVVHALSDVSFEVGYGEVVALLGANGAGKTTLIKILATLLLPTSGSVIVAGHDVVRDARRARYSTSVVFGGDRGLYGRLTGRENLRFFGMLAGVGRRDLSGSVNKALARVNLIAAADRRVETYSRGMRQRLHLAIGLIVQPRVLLLDEPTAGLDPVESARLREAVLVLRDEGVGILLTSHYLLDVEKLATRVLLLAEGSIQEDLTLAEFVRKSGHAATVTIRGRGQAPNVTAGMVTTSIMDSQVRGDTSSWEVDLRLREWGPELFDQISAICANATIDAVEVRETRLDEAFTVMSARHTP